MFYSSIEQEYMRQLRFTTLLSLLYNWDTTTLLSPFYGYSRRFTTILSPLYGLDITALLFPLYCWDITALLSPLYSLNITALFSHLYGFRTTAPSSLISLVGISLLYYLLYLVFFHYSLISYLWMGYHCSNIISPLHGLFITTLLSTLYCWDITTLLIISSL